MSVNSASKGKVRSNKKNNRKNSSNRRNKTNIKNTTKRKRKASIFKKIKNKIKNKLKKMILRKWDNLKKIDWTYRPENSKNFSTTCNWMTFSLVLLTSLFVYIENSLFYAFPLITVLAVFVKKGTGNRYKNSSKRDLLLYKRILLVNLFILLAIYFHYYEELWFVNILMFSIFLVPLGIAKVSEW